jgi:hypothetical protein
MMDRMRGSRVRCHISRRSSRGSVGNDGRGGVEFSITVERSGEEWTGGGNWRE